MKALFNLSKNNKYIDFISTIIYVIIIFTFIYNLTWGIEIIALIISFVISYFIYIIYQHFIQGVNDERTINYYRIREQYEYYNNKDGLLYNK